MKPTLPLLTAALVALTATTPAVANDDKVLNLYSARHYQTDEALYANFTKQTGIKINRIEAGDEALLERLRAEGKNSPADVLILADAARLWRAQIDGMFAPVDSKLLAQRIPETLRGGNEWFGYSQRARVIVYNKDKIKPDQIKTYEDLAKPEFKGMICSRSAAHPYMLSWIGSMVEHLGAEKATAWAQGVVANMARPPRGGDTDQIKGVATGECAIALTNTYYYVRLLKSTKADDDLIKVKVGMVWPNQASTGVHVNISGGGMLKSAPHKANAVKFLEYLASDEAQAFFAEGNNEWPAVKGVKINNPALDKLGSFKADTLPATTIGKSQIGAQKILDKVNWK